MAAPMCTRVLADFGARVIKVENPNGGDFARDYDDVVNGPGGLAAHFVWCNRGKESVTLNLKSPAGMDVLHRLLDRADAFVSNLAPGSTARLGLSPADLAESHPSVIPVEIDGYGPGGPISHKRAYDLLIQAEGGSCAVTGYPNMPAKPGPAVADFTTGLYAALSILALLFSRDRREGPAPAVGLSLFDVMTDIMGYQLTYTQHSGIDQQPLGVGSPAVAPYGAFPTRDGQTVVLGTTNDREWQRLATGDHRPPRPGRRRAFRHQHRPVRAPRHPRRGDRILVCTTRSRAHPEDRGRRRHRQLAVQRAKRGRGAPAARGARPLAARSAPPRARSRRCCLRRSSPVTIRRWARCPGWANTPTRYWPNSASDKTTSRRCVSRVSSDPRFDDAARERNGVKAMRETVIVEAVRTPVGKRNGGLSEMHAADLSALVLIALAERAGIDPEIVDDVVWGCVSQVGDQSSNIGRYSVLAAGWPETIPGTTVNRACGSSQQALDFAAQAVMSGQHDVVVAGGVEVMSRVPLGAARATGTPYGPKVLARYGDFSFNQGISAEMIAQKWGFSRTRLDEYSASSHERAAAAQDSGAFETQMIPVFTDGEPVVADEGVRRGTSVEKLAGLKPAFKDDVQQRADRRWAGETGHR